MLMYKCDKCGHANPMDAYMCGSCGSLLTVDGHIPVVACDSTAKSNISNRYIFIGVVTSILGLLVTVKQIFK